MKNLKYLLLALCIGFGSLQQLSAQETDKVQKVAVAELPVKVKETLKKYSNYNISKEITYTKNGASKIYRVKVQKGSWVQFLHIDENGKIVGIESNEGD